MGKNMELERLTQQHLQVFLIGVGAADRAKLGERPTPAQLSSFLTEGDSPVREEEGDLFAFSIVAAKRRLLV